MKFLLSADHHHFFLQNRHIAFENLLSEAETATLEKAVDAALLKRLSPRTLDNASAEALYRAGHDLFRDHPQIKKIVASRRLAEIAAPLFSCRPLRLACDQAIYSSTSFDSPFHKAFTIQQISCIQKICGGLLLLLAPHAGTPSTTLSLPKTPGSALFLHPQLPILWPELFRTPDLKALLILYTQGRSLYTLEPQDPHTHSLKKLSYAFGDPLTDATHPILLR